MARSGKIMLVISDLLAKEIARAPEEVRRIYESIPDESLERVTTSPASESLRSLYLSAGVVGPSSKDDALHVAIATAVHADAIVSWNFKHIVNYVRKRGFQAVNIAQGYVAIEIISPLEFAEYEK